ncbi:MAG: energy transducer TonB [Candidatus Lustribacter sp.]|jgi:TonB family protein
MFAIVLSTLLAQAAPAYLASCPAQAGRVTFQAPFIAPDSGVHPTNRRARFFLDVGSDGNVRRAVLVETSGDATFDGEAAEAAKNFRFAPPTQGCISTSSVVPEDFDVSLITLVRPPVGPTGVPQIPANAPASAVAVCSSTPLAQLKGIDAADTRQAPGTVDIDVGLSAAAKVTSAKIAKPSGNPRTDATALALAHDAEFELMLEPGCSARPTVYRLELTFH